MSINNNKDQRIENLEEKVVQLSRMLVKSFSYADQDPDTFLQNARRTTEAICRFIYTKEIGEPKGKLMLNDYGRELNQKKIIPDRIGILIGTIQTYGNYAAHAQEDLSETTHEWITPCQTALASLTNWFFLEYLGGNVPKELLSPVTSFSETASQRQKEKEKTNSSNKGKSTIYALIGIIAISLIVILFFVFKNQVSPTGIHTKINQDTDVKNEAIVKKQDELIDKLNKASKNSNAKRIAIIYFDNSSDDADLSKLRKGLADMLISDLSKIKILNVVERARLEEILKEQKLNNSKEFDASTASKVGKLLGAEYILTGAFFEMLGSLRIDARVIEVETGKIIKSEGVEGSSNTFFDLEKKLVIGIAGGLNVDLAQEKDFNKPSKKLSYQTSLLFSEGLDYMDKGENEKAIKSFKKVLSENPDFQPAQTALNKLTPSL